mmetsp:Transcript_136241/g.423371  ORF Transcript_136241/g.423371 Transcript_136241/m.423371 type:complete len:200 (+) Transcript_136241:952-1551(+)
MAAESSTPRTTVAGPPTSLRAALASWSATGASGVPASAKEMEASPPGACWNRGAGAGVSAPSTCSAFRKRLSASSDPSVPKMMVASPPTGPRTAGATGRLPPPREMDEVPPGAWWKRGAASGVSRAAPRSSWRNRKAAAESSLPSRTEDAPPTGPRALGTPPASQDDSLPPGAWENRGVASGVSTGAPRCAWRWPRASA